jgi:hypothetical protein
MEIAIIAGIGMVGYHLSQAGAEARPSKDQSKKLLPRVDGYPFGPGGSHTDRVRRFEDRARNRWKQSLAPHLTGIVSPNMARITADLQKAPHNNMTPFFRSARTQHAAPDMLSQRRMEMFTGATHVDTSLTGTYRPKVEVQLPHPTNRMVVSSTGTAGNDTMLTEVDRFSASIGTKHNNISPVPQIRVGPGLGLDANTPAADGFHPMLRVLPHNEGAITRNNLPGGFNHGASQLALGTVRPAFAKNRPDHPMITPCNRRPESGRAAVTAAMARPDKSRDDVGRLSGHLYFGSAGATGLVNQASTARDLAEGRIKPDTYHGTPAMNLGTDGVGAYVGAYIDPARIDAQQRETPGGFGFLQASAAARTAAPGYLLPATQRDLNPVDSHAHLNITPVTNNTQTRPMHAPAKTLRESVLRTQQVTNLVMPNKASTMDNETRDYDLDRDAKRASQVQGHTPLPGRTNVFETATMGIMRVRDDDTATCTPNHGVLRSAMRYGETLGQQTTNFNKLPPHNPHMDQIDLARQQLSGNELAIGPLFAARPGTAVM